MPSRREPWRVLLKARKALGGVWVKFKGFGPSRPKDLYASAVAFFTAADGSQSNGAISSPLWELAWEPSFDRRLISSALSRISQSCRAAT